jgi:hypothetical protein
MRIPAILPPRGGPCPLELVAIDLLVRQLRIEEVNEGAD